VTSLETLVRASQAQEQVRSSSLVVVRASIEPTPSEHERLASAREEWGVKVRSVESYLGAAAAWFDAGLIILQQQQQQYGIGNGEVVKGFSHHRHGRLVTPPSPRSLTSRPRHRRKRSSSVRGNHRLKVPLHQ
jgi:hypothetical protein